MFRVDLKPAGRFTVETLAAALGLIRRHWPTAHHDDRWHVMRWRDGKPADDPWLGAVLEIYRDRGAKSVFQPVGWITNLSGKPPGEGAVLYFGGARLPARFQQGYVAGSRRSGHQVLIRCP